MSLWSNGKATVCKTVDTGSIPVRLSIADIEQKQHNAYDKVWAQYEAGKLTLDNAIDAAHKTHVKLWAELGKLGYVDSRAPAAETPGTDGPRPR